MRTPVVVWWIWLAFALLNALDLALQWHHRAALVYGAVLALATGVAYACGLRPRMIADDAGIAIRNPLRDCTVPWGAIRAVDVGEAVQVHFSLPDGTEKVFPSWAMFSSSRAQLKADQRARKRATHLKKTSPLYNQLPDEARDTMGRTEAQLVAWQLDDRAERARANGTDAGQPTLTWAWLSVAVIAAPAIALVVLLLT
jgi:Bacterial PH domain